MGDEGLAIRELDFEAVANLEPPTLQLTGSADATIVVALTKLVETLHAKLITRGAREIVVDIRGLEFMNATCFNVLVNWLGMVNDLSPDERYLLRFGINGTIPWQRRSLHTLSCFATDLVVVEA
jgi:hypothetical protein